MIVISKNSWHYKVASLWRRTAPGGKYDYHTGWGPSGNICQYFREVVAGSLLILAVTLLALLVVGSTLFTVGILYLDKLYGTSFLDSLTATTVVMFALGMVVLAVLFVSTSLTYVGLVWYVAEQTLPIVFEKIGSAFPRKKKQRKSPSVKKPLEGFRLVVIEYFKSVKEKVCVQIDFVEKNKV
jgi:hypothetical protein